jgi:hypothetical protein
VDKSSGGTVKRNIQLPSRLVTFRSIYLTAAQGAAAAAVGEQREKFNFFRRTPYK